MTTLLAVSILIQKHVKSEIVRPKALMHYACRHSHELLQTWIGSMKIFLTTTQIYDGTTAILRQNHCNLDFTTQIGVYF